MNLTDLNYVVAVAEEGSFKRAADRCHVSQPTLSGQIRKLEDTLGVALFERRPRQVRLTAFGERIMPTAQRIVADTRAIVTLARKQKGLLDSSLRLGIIPTLGPYMLPWMVPAIRQRFPETRLVVHEDLSAPLVAALKAFDLDAIVMALPLKDVALASVALFDERFLLACHRDSVAAALEKIGDADLAECPLILLNEGHCLRDQALAICERQDGYAERLCTDYRAASLETARQMVAAGIGCTLLPALAVDRAVCTAQAIAIRPLTSPAAFRRIGLMFRKGCPLEAEIKHLVQVIGEVLPDAVSPIAEPPRG